MYKGNKIKRRFLKFYFFFEKGNLCRSFHEKKMTFCVKGLDIYFIFADIFLSVKQQ